MKKFKDEDILDEKNIEIFLLLTFWKIIFGFFDENPSKKIWNNPKEFFDIFHDEKSEFSNYRNTSELGE